MVKSENLLLVITLSFALLFPACSVIKPKIQLDPESEEFYTQVQYIITSEEEKIFLELPPEERPEFIEEFWKRRDPTPSTDFNEFKETYLTRIEEANRLFKSGGRPGWLQDRGRIYILFGPPNERITNPMGGRPIDAYTDPSQMTGSRRISSAEKPTEIWVYHELFSSLQRPQSIRLVFVDTHGTGDYKLTTNIDEVLPGTMGAQTEFAPNLALAHELGKEEAERIKLNLQRELFNFFWEFIKQKDRALESNLLIHIVLPYEKILFAQVENRLKANIELEIQIKSESKVIWEYYEQYDLNFREDDVDKLKGANYELNIPVTQWLKKGEYLVYIRLHNLTGNQETKKLLPIKI